MWHKAVQYLSKMGSVILIASILIWTLSYFPHDQKLLSGNNEQVNKINLNTSLSANDKTEQIKQIQLHNESEMQENSYIGQMGHFIEPAIAPLLGFDWKIGVSIISGLAAKEVVIGTMGVLYQAGDKSIGLKNRLQEQVHTYGKMIGQKVFSPLVAYALMVFVLIYFPCVAVIAAIRKEANWKWAVFTMVYTTTMAWCAAFITYQIGSLFI